jgi:hypothetical protein
MSPILDFPTDSATEELVTQDEILRLPPFRYVTASMFARRRREGFIPFVRLSRRVYLYRISEVLAALHEFDRPAQKKGAAT